MSIKKKSTKKDPPYEMSPTINHKKSSKQGASHQDTRKKAIPHHWKKSIIILRGIQKKSIIKSQVMDL
jgi:hypothetical protein